MGLLIDQQLSWDGTEDESTILSSIRNCGFLWQGQASINVYKEISDLLRYRVSSLAVKHRLNVVLFLGAALFKVKYCIAD